MERIVDVASDGLHLSLYRGFLLVSRDREEVGRVALDDIHAVIVHAHGVTWSGNIVAALAEHGAPIVFCAANHAPIAVTLPLAGHHAQGARMRAQWEAGLPLAKQLWKKVVAAKIRMQGSLLEANTSREAQAFDLLARRVRSGDPENVEAQAARRYWPALMGPAFRRDRNAEGPNALLNYGYAIMRATVARAVVAAGLHPTIGIHHANRGNAFALADDLMEPFRPLVDAVAVALSVDGVVEVTPAAKKRFTALIALDLTLAGERSPVSVIAAKIALSVGRSFEEHKPNLAMFESPTPVEWMALQRQGGLHGAQG